jgi:hypothetical protein
MKGRCKWFITCPLRGMENKGVIGHKWRREYCEGNWKSCKRYWMEERGVPHPDTLLPDGTKAGTSRKDAARKEDLV